MTVRDVQCEEIWAFVLKNEGHKWPHEASVKQKAHPAHYRGFHFQVAHGYGRLSVPDHDGFQPHIGAIDAGLSDRADFAQIIKV